MGKIERGYFGPSQGMLKLTETFIDRVTTKLRERGVSCQVKRHPEGAIFLVNNVEVYQLFNNGIEANWSFRGYHR